MRTELRGRRLLDYLAILPLGLPGTVMAVGILLAFIRPPFSIYGTIWILLVAYVARFIPLATRSANATFRQIDPSLEEAARITGASWLTAIRRILVPLSRPGLLVAFLLVFIPAFGELSATILLYTGGTETIAVAIYRLNDLGQLEVVSALAVFTIGVILTLSLLVSWLSGPGADAARRPGADAVACSPWRSSRSGDLDKTFRQLPRAERCQSRHRREGVRHLPRPLGLRQDDDAAHARGLPRRRTAARSTSPAGCSPRLQGVVPPERRRMGMVFQNYAVWPHMTVLENVAFGLRIAKVDRRQMQERVARVLAAVGLTGLEQRHPGQLSGGQQQRVALARSLVVEPSILLLDEPLSNLDAKLRERMRVELKALQRRMGLTFIYVTHDQAEAMALSDRIVVFNQGAVQQIGAPREIYERPANLFVADFMGLVNRLPAIAHRAGAMASLACASARIELRATIGPEAAAGSGAVTLVIRPEAIRLGDGAAGENRLAGTIADATFLGNIIDYQVDIGGGVLRVQGDRQAVLELGARVALCRAGRGVHGHARSGLRPCAKRALTRSLPADRSIGRRKRKTSLRNGEPHEATQHAVHHVGRAQSARARLRRPPDDPHAQPRSPGGARRALHGRLLQLADLRALARELSHRALRPPDPLLGQRHRL